jgi:fibro-slime domain-containing protein
LASHGCALNAASYSTWYHDGPNSKLILGKFIRLPQIAAGTYQFDSSGDPAYNLPNINCGNATPTTTCNGYTGFYPLNGLGYGNQSAGRNYSFTSEARYPFTYAGGEVLSFTGDDDVLVYIGGRKVVDIGGIHAALSSSVTLSAPSVTTPASAATTPPITLVVGQTYEIDVFQAERNTTGSNYKLTLSGFSRKISVCTPPPPSPAPVTTTYTQAYTGTCPTGYAVQWNALAYSAALTGASTITFGAQTGPTVAGPWLPAPMPAAIASAPAPDPAICTLTGPAPTCPKSLSTPLGMANTSQPDLLLTANLTSSCAGGGSIGGLTTPDGTAACPGPPNPGACATNNDCFQDFHCVAGACVWNGTSGYKDPACPGIDLTINATCTVAGVEQMLACNRGNTKVNSGQTIKVAIDNNPPGGNSAGSGGPTACSVTLGSDLLPGTCISVPGCGTNGNRHAYVNWDHSIVECNYKNNESSAKDNGGGCPAACGATPPGSATLNSWNVTYTCVANE